MVLRRLILHWLGYALILAAPAAAQYDSFRTRILTVIPSPTGGTTGEVRFVEQRTNGTNYVGFKAGASIGTSGIWTLPTTDGASGNCLAWASSWTLGWAACSGGGGGGGISSLGLQTGSTQSFANADDTNVTLAISSSSNVHTFTLGFTGTLAKTRQNGATVYNDASNTWSTGNQSFAAATSLTLPVATGAAPTANGRIAYDSTANLLKAGYNGSTKTIATTDSTVAAASALAANPSACGAGQFVTDLDADGTLTCGTPAGGGNVNGPATHSATYIPVWDTANSRNLLEGLPYATSATANALVQRDGSAGITGAAGTFTTLYAAPGSNVASLTLRRNNSSQTAGIAVFATEGGTELSRIDKDGKFTGNAATATALAADPAACSSGQFVTDISASGALTCSAGGGGSGNVSGPGSSTITWIPTWSNTGGTQLGGGLATYATTSASPNTALSVVTRSSTNGTLIWDAGGTVLDCRVYGVKADGSTDDATAFENCINALPNTGGDVLLPEGDMVVASTVDVGDGAANGSSHSTRYRIRIKGRGRASEDTVSGNSNAQRGGTRIRWTGSALSTKTISGATNTTPVQLTVTGHGWTGGTSGASQQMVMIDQAGKSGTCNNDSGANGVYQIRIVDVNTIELRGSVGNGTYNAACPGTLYYGDPILRVNGPILDVQIEDVAFFGGATNSGSTTGTLSTAVPTAATGVEWRNVNGGGMNNVSIARVGIVGMHLRAIDGTGSSTAYFNCNARFGHIEVHAPRHQRTSGIHLGGWEETGGADTCSNKFNDINIAYGGGAGSFGIAAQFADNNYISNAQVNALGNLNGTLTPTGGNWWRDVQVYHITAPYWFPTGNVCDKCYASQYYPAKVDTTSVTQKRMLWMPNYGEQELMAEVPPITQRNIAGISDIGRFWNGFTQLIDGSASAPAYSFAQDTDTGFYRIGSNTLGFAANGANRWTVDATNFTRYASSASYEKIQGDADVNQYIEASGTSVRPALQFWRTRGTIASKSDILTNDQLGNIAWWGQTGGICCALGGLLQVWADTISGSNMFSSIRFQTMQNTTAAERMRIDAQGVKIAGDSRSNILATSPSDGYLILCTDCQKDLSCSSGGSGALAKRLGGSWVCN